MATVVDSIPVPLVMLLSEDTSRTSSTAPGLSLLYRTPTKERAFSHQFADQFVAQLKLFLALVVFDLEERASATGCAS